MKDGQRLIVKVIKSEEDLPKEGIYIVKCADNDAPEFMKMAESGNIFWQKVAWYLIPEETNDSDIEVWADIRALINDEDNPGHKRIDAYAWELLVVGAKAVLNGEIKHIEK
jgi:hypothetical protein